MTLNYAYVIKTVIFVPTPHHSRINSEPLTPCKNIPKPQRDGGLSRSTTAVVHSAPHGSNELGGRQGGRAVAHIPGKA